MLSIGTLATRTGVKVPTIRYYEQMGLLPEPERSAGNQRRYCGAGLERLAFIKHARDLGFSIEAIKSLIDLHENPDKSCAVATDLARTQLSDVQMRIARLQRLEAELDRIANGCDGHGATQDCYVLTALSDHDLCRAAH